MARVADELAWLAWLAWGAAIISVCAGSGSV